MIGAVGLEKCEFNFFKQKGGGGGGEGEETQPISIFQLLFFFSF